MLLLEVIAVLMMIVVNGFSAVAEHAMARFALEGVLAARVAIIAIAATTTARGSLRFGPSGRMLQPHPSHEGK
jgi:hypothetical protein